MDFNPLRLLTNPFKKLTKEEEQELKSLEADVKKDIKELAIVAKDLLQDERYKKLLNEYKKIYEQNVRLLIYFDCDSIDKYVLSMRKFQMQLRHLDEIINTPKGFIESEKRMDKEKK